MDGPELRLQRVFDRVELVSGPGDPGAGTACLMSLVAGLAGEGHTDDPPCASRLIGAYVIPVNDRMPGEARQRLKPFAPRIIGTRDGLDAERGAILCRVLATEVLPAIAAAEARRPAAAPGAAAAAGPPRAARRGGLARLWGALFRASLRRRILGLMDAAGTGPRRPGCEIALARAAGQLLALCASQAGDAREAQRLWTMAIGLLDRMCDVGMPARQAGAASRPVGLASLEASLPLRPGRTA